MTNTNSSWNIKQEGSAEFQSSVWNAPFLLSPVGKDYLWGGTRLNDDFSKNLNCQPLAETWECSTHPDGQSVVRSGPYAGQRLLDVLNAHPELIGTHPQMANGLPILVKFIDAKSDLSVQVHPTDEYARIHENGALGKTEVWYVVEAAKDARLIYGFLRDMDKKTVRKALQEGTLEHYLQKIPVKKGDFFFIPAGQIHAICSGCLVAEVQESSNLTYRLYDYNRVDKNGALRPLHIDKALEVANLKSSIEPRQPMRVVRFRKGVMIELLCRCQYFQIEKITLDTQRCRDLVRFRTQCNSFRVLLCLEGCGVLRWGNGESIDFFRGDCLFVPANSVEYSAHGNAQLLRISC